MKLPALLTGGASTAVRIGGGLDKSALAVGPGATAIVADQVIAPGQLLPRPGPLVYRLPEPPIPYAEPTEMLAQLWALLARGGASPLGIIGSRAAGLVGMGGIGKSTLAGALARDPRAREAYPHGAAWLSFGQDAVVHDKQDELLMALTGVRQALRSASEAHGALEIVCQQLPSRLLVVLDDVWTEEAVHTAFAGLPNVQLLVTSRDRRVLAALQAEPLELGLLSPDAALNFLAMAAACPRETLPAQSGEVVRRCGHLPLALASAGALIRRQLYDWPEILTALANARLHEFESKWLDDPLKRDLAAVLKVSIDALPKALQAFLFDFAVLQEDVAVPEEALVNLWSGPDRSRPRARAAARELADRSLLQVDAERRYQIHDLYRDYLRDVAGDLAKRNGSLAKRYAALCPTGWPSGPDDGYFFQSVVHHRATAGETVTDQLFDAAWLGAQTENRGPMAIQRA